MTKGTIQNQESFLNRIASSLAVKEEQEAWQSLNGRISRNIKHLKDIQLMT